MDKARYKRALEAIKADICDIHARISLLAEEIDQDEPILISEDCLVVNLDFARTARHPLKALGLPSREEPEDPRGA